MIVIIGTEATEKPVLVLKDIHHRGAERTQKTILWLKQK